MAATRRKELSSLPTKVAACETATCYVALCLVALILVNVLNESASAVAGAEAEMVRGQKFGGRRRPCDEIYVVEEGETLHTISDKCGDPYIVEQNPHIHDPDDVYPGLVLKITPSYPSKTT
ncbi:uncharacterized protein LOC110100409 [Dendrobium catenatum]|uniref:LysM domain-containing protein n=1 Tax=Dendrobium catenatum TaxID=906689 RepID=A0A2I0W0Q0_9ASPA|nr:uncharacterized protein LOC110100409 [Dendrobium catenatum]PKU69242.1 hypothetical protein MA16_Dca002512 [Dendrobium catenatum]